MILLGLMACIALTCGIATADMMVIVITDDTPTPSATITAEELQQIITEQRERWAARTPTPTASPAPAAGIIISGIVCMAILTRKYI